MGDLFRIIYADMTHSIIPKCNMIGLRRPTKEKQELKELYRIYGFTISEETGDPNLSEMMSDIVKRIGTGIMENKW